MMGKFAARNAVGNDDAVGGRTGSQSRNRPIAAQNRRVIFPSLHQSPVCPRSGPRPIPKPASENGCPSNSNYTRSVDRCNSLDLVPSPTDVSANIEHFSNPTLLRANSLDGITIPLPKLSLADDGKSNDELPQLPSISLDWKPTSLAQAPQAADVLPVLSRSRAPSLFRPGPSAFVEAKPSKSHFYGDTVPRTYYPAASVPKPVPEKQPPSRSKPPPSILRRRKKTPPSSQITCEESSVVSAPSPLDGGGQPCSPRSSQVDPASCLPSAIPTLASPASLKSLLSSRSDDGEGGKEGIGESEDDLNCLSDIPKILPRKECKVRRIQSDTIVTKNEEEHSKPRRESTRSTSHESSVSRHSSLECLANNRRILFDPLIKVYEFGITDYEMRGGDKWWSEEELASFKQEAIERIRLRSTKVIPTGTGRALTVITKPMNSANPKTAGKPGGSVSFNHPALGCEEEFDPDSSQSSRQGSMKKSIVPSQERAAAREMRNFLIVDPHEIFLALFTKSLKHMVPHASVATARSAEEAMARIEAARKAFPLSDGGATHGFDVIIIEERLHSSLCAAPQAGRLNTAHHAISTQTAGDDLVQRRGMTSGSALICHLNESERELCKGGDSESSIRRSLLVGVSSRLSLDRDKLEKGGADCVWGKPPPEMNATLKNELLKLLMKKRNRTRGEDFD